MNEDTGAQDDFAPDAPEKDDKELIDKIMAAVAKTTEEAIAPLKQALAERAQAGTPLPEGEQAGGGNPSPSPLGGQRAAYERAGLGEYMKFDDFIKGIEV